MEGGGAPHKVYSFEKGGWGCERFYPVLGGGDEKFQTCDFPTL